MLPYVLIFALSCFALRMGVQSRNKVFRNVLILIAVLLPALLGGFRDSSVGTDALGHARTFTECAQFNNFMSFYAIADTNIGYAGVIYLISRFTNDVFWSYFSIQLLTTFFIWKAIDENVEVRYKAFALLIYYLMFYSYSLNVMRQMLAASILLYGYRFIKKRMLLRYLICVACASMFHVTAFVGGIVYLIYWLSLGNDDRVPKKNRPSFVFRKIIKKLRFLLIFTGLLIAAVCVYYGREIIAFMRYQLSDFYGIYYDSRAGFGGGTLRYTAYMLALLAVTAWTFRVKNTQTIFYITMSILSLILFQTKLISTQAFRIALYFSIYFVILIPQVMGNLKLENNRRIVMSMTILILCLYSYDFFVIQHYNGTFPYILAK